MSQSGQSAEHRSGTFLATTALEAFWAPDRPILFAGEWCRRPEREASWSRLSAEVLADPWDEPDARRAAEAYCAARVTAVLGPLADYLNATHGEPHALRYWRILLGPWLLHFTQALFDRYTRLERAFARHPELDTRVLAPTSYVTPRDWADYTYLVFADGYNLQLFSQLLESVGEGFPAFEHPVRPHGGAAAPSVRGRVRRAARRVYGRCLEAVGARRPILLHGARLARRDLWQLVRATRGQVWPYDPPLEVASASVDHGRRSGLAGLAVPDADRFTDRLVALLPVNLPMAYLEGYGRLRRDTAAVRRRRPRVVVSGLGWKSNERFKCVAADAAEHGGRLIGLQHGGSSWVMDHSPMDTHIASVADEYWSWGCPGPGLVPTPDPQLSSAVASTAVGRDDGDVLFVGTMFTRFVTSFRSQPIGGQVLAYIRAQCSFFAALAPAERNRFLVRLYPHELGWQNRRQLEGAVPGLRFDDFSRPFPHRLAESALVVADNLQTAFVETLCANRPVLLFYDPRYWAMSASAAPWLDRLAEVGILHYGPEAAATQLSTILEAPQAWWAQESVQRSRQAFLSWCIDRRPWLATWRTQLLAACEQVTAEVST